VASLQGQCGGSSRGGGRMSAWQAARRGSALIRVTVGQLPVGSYPCTPGAHLTASSIDDVTVVCARSTSQQAAASLCGIVVPTTFHLRNGL
jgi:hypothetical protein